MNLKTEQFPPKLTKIFLKILRSNLPSTFPLISFTKFQNKCYETGARMNIEERTIKMV